MLPISRLVTTTAAAIIATLRRAGRPPDDFHDVYIAATARTRDRPVLTPDVDHVDRIDDLRVVDWETFWDEDVNSLEIVLGGERTVPVAALS